jgi:methionyl-tRNA synthetase
MNKKFYITTPIYYPNAQPHIGTLYSTLLADVAMRWHKLRGYQTHFVTGTDEHGQKIQEKAESAGMQPKAFVDSVVPGYKKLWERYNLQYDRFIRTTDTDHEAGVKTWIEQMQKQGDIYKASYSGWYCVPCETFVNVGSEPVIDAEGKFLCPTCKRHLRELQEESYFFKLSAYAEKLLAFYEENPDFITPKERLQEVISFVKSGLKDLSLSRKTVSWGIPFPGDSSHTVYVWADALNNYITAVGYGQAAHADEFKKWWPADVHVMAKDIVRFHAIYWPAFLMAAQLPLPKKLVVHGYILVGDAKMSKSLGNAMDPAQLADWYGVDQVRYYLTRQMAITQDGNFDLKDLENRIATELANNLSNLLNRTLTLALNNNLAQVNPGVSLEPKTAALRMRCEESVRLVFDAMDKYYYHIAINEVLTFLSEVNAYFHALEPWKLAKANPELFKETITAACHSLYTVGLLLWPVMPDTMEKLLAALGMKLELGTDYEEILRTTIWDKTFMLEKTDPLFVRPEAHSAKIEEAKATEEAQTAPQVPEIGIEDFVKIQLVSGKIIACEPVKDSEKLLRFEVDAGAIGIRQILSGVAKELKPEDLIGRQGIFVANLKPRKMAGLVSHGMLLYGADADGKLRLATVEGGANGVSVK